ncbi:MAG: alpha/beta fold hydrolase [Alphaproteobacteria bacterium]
MPYVATAGARIAYLIEGAGPTIVFLHGTASTAAQWAAIRAPFAGDFATVAVDLHGYGDSDPWTAERRIELADEASAVAAVLQRVAGPVHLVGHSYGGAVALKLALTGREPLASLTLIEPASFHLLSDVHPADAAALAEITAVADAVTNLRPEEGLPTFVDYWNGAGTWAGLSAGRRAGLCRLAGTIAMNFRTARTEPARLEDCTRLRVPTLVLTGERSTRAAKWISARLAAALPRHLARTVEGAGHMLPRTHPETVIHAIAAHVAPIAGVEAPARRLLAA